MADKCDRCGVDDLAYCTCDWSVPPAPCECAKLRAELAKVRADASAAAERARESERERCAAMCESVAQFYERRAQAVRDDSDYADGEAAHDEIDECEMRAVTAYQCADKVRGKPVAHPCAIAAPRPALDGGTDRLAREGEMRRYPWDDRPDLYECATCSTKPGSPTLCGRCLTARHAAGLRWRGPRNPDAVDAEETPTPRVAAPCPDCDTVGTRPYDGSAMCAGCVYRRPACGGGRAG